VRHGRTAWNADGRFQGHIDIALDDEGRAQAAALASLVRDWRIDASVASDLVRAQETARIVLGEREIAVRLDPDWREMRFGAWEGLRWDEIVAVTPALAEQQRTLIRSYDPPGGENFDQLCERVARATQRVVASIADDGVALIATHAGPLHALLRNLLGEAEAEAMRVRFLTASITRFRCTDGAWSLVDLNITAGPRGDLKAADSPARKSPA
jgi:broad specificity phosphatase PhoE